MPSNNPFDMWGMDMNDCVMRGERKAEIRDKIPERNEYYKKTFENIKPYLKDIENLNNKLSIEEKMNIILEFIHKVQGRFVHFYTLETLYNIILEKILKKNNVSNNSIITENDLEQSWNIIFKGNFESVDRTWKNFKNYDIKDGDERSLRYQLIGKSISILLKNILFDSDAQRAINTQFKKIINIKKENNTIVCSCIIYRNKNELISKNQYLKMIIVFNFDKEEPVVSDDLKSIKYEPFDISNPHRNISNEEKIEIQNTLNNIINQFGKRINS